MTAILFRKFISNLAVSNREEISTTYKRITRRLNRDFRDSDSEFAHSLQVGSFGRGTAIDGISDLDMVFELSPRAFERFRERAGNGPSAMLQAVKQSLLETFPGTKIRGDGPVVTAPFRNMHFEILPAFLQDDGSYIYGVTKHGGSWEPTDPRAERDEFARVSEASGGLLRDLARMLRAWKNKHGVAISGWLIDTLCYDFVVARPQWRGAAHDDYLDIVIDAFDYLAGLADDGAWLAPGSGARVTSYGKFTTKASRAATKCRMARDKDTLEGQSTLLRGVFGKSFELMEERYGGDVRTLIARAGPLEEFVEDRYTMDIRHDVRIDYEVSFNQQILLDLIHLPRRFRRLIPGRSVRFYIAETTVPNLDVCDIFWKVRNRGPNARGQERGQLLPDEGRHERVEHTKFDGPHYVEVYVVQEGRCIARDRAPVQIVEEGSN